MQREADHSSQPSKDRVAPPQPTVDLLADAATLVELAAEHLRHEFRDRIDEHEREDLAQSAYADLLEQHRRGYELRNPRALIKTAAWRLANKRTSRSPEHPSDPQEGALARLRDSRSGVEAVLETRLDLVRGAEALAQLPHGFQVAFRCTQARVSPRTAARRLGIQRSTYYKYRDRAIVYVAAAMAGESEDYDEAVYELISKFVLAPESLDAAERRRARQLIRRDPYAGALARQLRRNGELLGAAVAPLMAEAVLDDRAIENALNAYERLSLGSRSAQDAAEATAALASAGGARGAGTAAGGGLLGALGLSGGAAKVVGTCLVGGAAASACIAIGVLPAPNLGGVGAGGEPAKVERRDRSAPVKRSAPALLPVANEVAPAPAQPVAQPTAESSDSSGGAAENDQQSKLANSGPTSESVVAPSAPATEQEFGVASAAVPASGAPPDTNDADGAGAGTVRQEFGP